jgi:16S rRNA (adenine1518-N6/adenine1519-N6)-dimethyltransferase
VKLSAIRTALAELQLTPSKTLGQNFLYHQNLAQWIVAQLNARPGEHLVEIGPGLGALTAAALETGAAVTAVEKDGRLAKRLRTRFAGQPNLTVEHRDALDFDVRTLWPLQPVKVFGNLPYYVSTPLLFHFTSQACPAQEALFLLQRELAERLACCGPGTKDYGILSLVVGRRWQVKLLRTLPAGVFFPEPKVESALIALTPRAPGELAPCDVPVFESLVRAGFSQRRKQLRKLLPAFAGKDLLGTWAEVTERLGALPTVRGEELGLRQWIALANIVSPVTAAAAQNADGEQFDVVDALDQVIGTESRGKVHAQNLLHRAIHIFVFNTRGELFLQKRSPWKDKHPGKWDSSAAGHLDSGETYLAAARRELTEELGLAEGAQTAHSRLEEIGRLDAGEPTGWEFIRLFRTISDGPFRWPAAEIEWGGFFPLAVIEAWVQARAADFAPGFLSCGAMTRAGEIPARG